MARPGPKKGSPRVPGSGRKVGTLNHATRDIKALAQLHGPAAIAQLVGLMKQTDNPTVARAAASELLDRGYGRPAQTIEAVGNTGPREVVISREPRESDGYYREVTLTRVETPKSNLQ
jgi:hypothetical protein